MTLDLNCPEDAKEYIQSWVELGGLLMGQHETRISLEAATPDEHLRLALQLFLYCDPRPIAGTLEKPH